AGRAGRNHHLAQRDQRRGRQSRRGRRADAGGLERPARSLRHLRGDGDALMAGHVRGFDMLSMRKFVHKNWGDDGLRALGDKLAPRGMGHLASDVILPMEWRPHEEWCALMEGIDETFSQPGQERAAARMGRFNCEDQMKTVHKVLMRLLRPGWLL